MYLEEVLNVKDNAIDGEIDGNLEKYRRRVSWVVSQLSPPTNSLPSSWSSCLNIQTMKLVAYWKKLILLQLRADSHVSIWLKTCCVFFHGHCHLPHRSAGAGRHLRPTSTLSLLSPKIGLQTVVQLNIERRRSLAYPEQTPSPQAWQDQAKAGIPENKQ